MKQAIKRLDAVLRKLMPQMCIAEWGRADTETVLRDAMLCKEKGLAAISLLPAAASAARRAAVDVKVFCFVDDAARIPASGGQKNAAVQLFIKDNRIDEVPDIGDAEIIPAFALRDIEHLDWTRIILAGKKLGGRGFMFIDDGGEHIHKFYDFLDIVGDSWNGEVHYCGATNDLDKLDDAYRLVEKVRPNLIPKLRLFVGAEFFRNLDFHYKSI